MHTLNFKWTLVMTKQFRVTSLLEIFLRTYAARLEAIRVSFNEISLYQHISLVVL